MSETEAGRLARVYAELGRRELKALACESERVTGAELAVLLRERMEDR